MQVIYNGTDISPSIQATQAIITDRSGGHPDAVTLQFSDTEGLWSQWKPTKGDTLRVMEAGFDSGLMYIDEISQRAGRFGIGALSIPQESKTARSQAWESVRFMEFATQIASRYGFNLKSYGIDNHLYERVDQVEEPDFSFLAGRCSLEGYTLKIADQSVVIYDESSYEKIAPDPQLAVIQESSMNGDFAFIDKSVGIYEKCIIRGQTAAEFIEGEFSAAGVAGPTLIKRMYVSNKVEANRWARGILRSHNKHMITGSLTIDLNINYAAGTTVQIADTGMFDGVFFIDSLTHDLINNRTKLKLRKPLEGY
ncbi:phage late control D family protein [Paenibacillus antibioticophila]|uniref:phage late control D family protein n=1 Tax=Paenibacillus antibioticophila TaxID=1274374 RepID=UPI0005CACE59|nr:hypothetical protein [Paenibacillus antibioticophila]